MFGMQIGQMGQVGGFSLTRLIASMYQNGEQGAWYDPSDLSTLFQDTAGTVPVTAVEQAVALMLDKSGRGNHASQATSTKWPRYSRRVNLLTKTEQFDDAAWAKTNLTATPNATTAPDGTTTADKWAEGAITGLQRIAQTFTVVNTTEYTFSVYVKAAERSWVALQLSTGFASTPAAYFNLATGTIGSQTGSPQATMQSAGNGWYRCTIKATSNASGPGATPYIYVCSANDVVSYAGDGTSGIFVWGASLTLGIDNHIPYQWVNTPTDYDADPAKFPGYLSFDGVDDALATGNIDFTGTDKMTVWAGVTKLSDAATGTVVELSATKSANNGVFALFAPLTLGSPDISWYSKGTSERLAGSTSESAPVTLVTTGIGDISGDISSFRVNGAVVQTQTADQGTGNFGNYPIYIGARAGTSLYFNGRLYPLIIRGAQSSLSQIEAAELHIRGRMKL